MKRRQVGDLPYWETIAEDPASKVSPGMVFGERRLRLEEGLGYTPQEYIS
jgi:hypothetical protein